MNLRPIRTKRDHKAARKRLSAYFDNEPMPGTEEDDHFEILVMLVEAYEAKHVSIDTPHSIEAMRFRREQGGHTVQNLAGSTSLQRFNALLNAPLESNAAISRLLNTPAPWEW